MAKGKHRAFRPRYCYLPGQALPHRLTLWTFKSPKSTSKSTNSSAHRKRRTRRCGRGNIHSLSNPRVWPPIWAATHKTRFQLHLVARPTPAHHTLRFGTPPQQPAKHTSPRHTTANQSTPQAVSATHSDVRSTSAKKAATGQRMTYTRIIFAYDPTTKNNAHDPIRVHPTPSPIARGTPPNAPSRRLMLHYFPSTWRNMLNSFTMWCQPCAHRKTLKDINHKTTRTLDCRIVAESAPL